MFIVSAVTVGPSTYCQVFVTTLTFSYNLILEASALLGCVYQVSTRRVSVRVIGSDTLAPTANDQHKTDRRLKNQPTGLVFDSFLHLFNVFVANESLCVCVYVRV